MYRYNIIKLYSVIAAASHRVSYTVCTVMTLSHSSSKWAPIYYKIYYRFDVVWLAETNNNFKSLSGIIILLSSILLLY